MEEATHSVQQAPEPNHAQRQAMGRAVMVLARQFYKAPPMNSTKSMDPVARFQAFRLVPSLEYQLETVHSALSPERRKSFAQRVSSNQSLRCRETEFSKQRQRGRNGFDGSTTPLQRQSLAKQLRQFGASRRERGNLCQRENAWWG